MVLLEENPLASSEGNQNTPVAEPVAPPYFFIPQTLHNWPWQKTISPHYRSCQTEATAWFESFNLSPQVQEAYRKCDYSLLAALTYPHSSHFNLRSSCELMKAFFVLDDEATDLPIGLVIKHYEVTRDTILHVDKPHPEGEHIIGEITRQFWKRASSAMPRPIVERFKKSWGEYIDAVVLQAQRRSQQYICTLDEYIAARRDNVGLFPSFALLEQSLELDIPHEVMEHPYMQSLNKYTCDMVFLDNDLVSYKKEFLANDADYNIITVVQKHLGRDLEGALQWVLNYYDQNVQNFLVVREKVLKKDGFKSFGPRIDREVADYVDGIGVWVRGYNEWNFATWRYFGDDGPKIQQHRKVVLT